MMLIKLLSTFSLLFTLIISSCHSFPNSDTLLYTVKTVGMSGFLVFSPFGNHLLRAKV